MDGTVESDWDELEGMELSFIQIPDTEVSAKVGWLFDGTGASMPSDFALTPRERRHIDT